MELIDPAPADEFLDKADGGILLVPLLRKSAFAMASRTQGNRRGGSRSAIRMILDLLIGEDEGIILPDVRESESVKVVSRVRAKL